MSQRSKEAISRALPEKASESRFSSCFLLTAKAFSLEGRATGVLKRGKGWLAKVGLQLSRNKSFPGTEQLKEMCNEVLRDMLKSSMVHVLKNASNDDVRLDEAM